MTSPILRTALVFAVLFIALAWSDRGLLPVLSIPIAIAVVMATRTVQVRAFVAGVTVIRLVS